MDPRKLAEFYVTVFGGVVRDFGNGYIAVTPEDNDQTGSRRPRMEPVPGLIVGNFLFQQADAPSPAPGWVHLDCQLADGGDREAAISAVVAAGGKFVENRGDSNFSWTVLEDPEGNPFCVVG